MNQLLDRLREDFKDEDVRYAYVEAHLNASLAAQIKALRGSMTQGELASKSGTKQSGISRFENANHSEWKTETLRKLARAFGLRLRISFEEFGTLVPEIENFKGGVLTRRRFEDDPAFKEPVPEPEPEEAFAGANTLQRLAGPKVGDKIANWDTRLAMANEILKWSEIWPQSGTLQQAAGAKPVVPSSVPSDDPYRGLRIVPPQPSLTLAVTPANKTTGSIQYIGGLQIRLDFEAEPKDKAA
jgi:transcriptional regulator with XRE-family HTH domain